MSVSAALPSGSGCVLRCVASERIGMGHALRMLSLARELPGSCFVVDAETARILRARPGPMPEIREIAGDPASGGWIDERPAPERAVLDLLFHGNSGATVAEVARLKAAGTHVTVIDSMPPDHFDAAGGAEPDILVTPYFAADRLRPHPRRARWLNGPGYAILPRELAECRTRAARTGGGRILIACGGSDPGALSARILEACAGVPAAIDLVIGPMFAAELTDRLEQLAHARTDVTLHRAPPSLLPLYATAGLLIGRPGLTRYEAACMGVNAIYLAEGPGYADYFAAFSDSGMAEIHRAASAGGTDAFLARIDGLRDPAALARAMRPNTRAMDIVDGRGAERVARAILGENGTETA